jgi:hypothetical protein
MADWISPEGIKNCAETLAIFVGGAWAVWRFWIRRERETTLDIDLTPQTIPRVDGRFVVFLDVTFTNRSAVRLSAKRLRYNGTPSSPYAYSDDDEKLKYSGSLLLRKLPADAPPDAQIPWFSDAPNNSPRADDIQEDVFYDYEISGETDFWMEPGECYHCGIIFVLNPGLYHVMVTFIGNTSDDEFWRRIFILRVPSESPKPNETTPANV